MNKKERTEKAMEDFIHEVDQNPETVSVGVADNCAFCTIHLRKNLSGRVMLFMEDVCKGCPFANRRGASGCVLFDAYQELRFKKPKEDVLIRVRRNLKAIQEVLISIPAERFTFKGWKYFTELEPLMFIK